MSSRVSAVDPSIFPLISILDKNRLDEIKDEIGCSKIECLYPEQADEEFDGETNLWLRENDKNFVDELRLCDEWDLQDEIKFLKKWARPLNV
jgi:hypothetical protein